MLESWYRTWEINSTYHICITSDTDTYMWHLPICGFILSILVASSSVFKELRTLEVLSSEEGPHLYIGLALCKVKFKDPSPREDSLLHLSSEMRGKPCDGGWWVETVVAISVFTATRCQESPQCSYLGGHWVLKHSLVWWSWPSLKFLLPFYLQARFCTLADHQLPDKCVF